MNKVELDQIDSTMVLSAKRVVRASWIGGVDMYNKKVLANTVRVLQAMYGDEYVNTAQRIEEDMDVLLRFAKLRDSEKKSVIAMMKRRKKEEEEHAQETGHDTGGAEGVG